MLLEEATHRLTQTRPDAQDARRGEKSHDSAGVSPRKRNKASLPSGCRAQHRDAPDSRRRSNGSSRCANSEFPAFRRLYSRRALPEYRVGECQPRLRAPIADVFGQPLRRSSDRQGCRSRIAPNVEAGQAVFAGGRWTPCPARPLRGRCARQAASRRRQLSCSMRARASFDISFDVIGPVGRASPSPRASGRQSRITGTQARQCP